MSENLPATISGLNEDDFINAASQNENFGKGEQVIPLLKILQPLNPEVDEGNAAYIPGAKAGMFLSTATGQLFDGRTGLLVVPMYHVHSNTEWHPRSEGGGFVRDWGATEGWKSRCAPDQREAYQPMTTSGTTILKARHFYCMVMDGEGGALPVVFPFQNTTLKVARWWTSKMINAPKIMTTKGPVTPAYHYYVYKVTLEQQKNDKGRWFIPRVDFYFKDGRIVTLPEMPNGKEIWNAANVFIASLKSGDINLSSAPEDGNIDEDQVPF